MLPESFNKIGYGTVAGIPYLGHHRDRRGRDRDVRDAHLPYGAGLLRDRLGSGCGAARRHPRGLAGLPRLRPERRASPESPGASGCRTYGSVDAIAGVGYEFQVIAAVVVGGVAIFGGSGTVLGAALGALLLNTINSALVVVNVSSFWSSGARGGAADRCDRVRPSDRAPRRSRAAHAKESSWLTSTTSSRATRSRPGRRSRGGSISASSSAGRRSSWSCSAPRSPYGASVSPYFLQSTQPLLHLPERGRGRDHGAAAHADRRHR